jgi:hypothetical protein
MDLVDRAYSTFTNQELERLVAYRAAVAAGFYTDWEGVAETVDDGQQPPVTATDASATPEQPAR